MKKTNNNNLLKLRETRTDVILLPFPKINFGLWWILWTWFVCPRLPRAALRLGVCVCVRVWPCPYRIIIRCWFIVFMYFNIKMRTFLCRQSLFLISYLRAYFHINRSLSSSSSPSLSVPFYRVVSSIEFSTRNFLLLSSCSSFCFNSSISFFSFRLLLVVLLYLLYSHTL